MNNSGTDIDIDSFWEYSDPAASEERFRQVLPGSKGDARLELLTQIARTYGLRQQFGEAHELLDEVEGQLDEAGSRPRVRYLLERGRTYNTSGSKEEARSLFVDAWDLALEENLEGLAVDAAHMVAITYAGHLEAVDWNRRGLELARTSQDTKAQALIPAMLNNNAWDLFDMERYSEALPWFEEAESEWTSRGNKAQIQIAWWSVARCLRALERFEEALAIQQDLEAEHAVDDTVDGYVFEELAENLLALGRQEEAKPYFVKAFEELSKDSWIVENEAERLARLESLAAGG